MTPDVSISFANRSVTRDTIFPWMVLKNDWTLESLPHLSQILQASKRTLLSVLNICSRISCPTHPNILGYFQQHTIDYSCSLLSSHP